MTDDTLYKALRSGGVSPYQGYQWPLPSKTVTGWQPGGWVDAGGGALVECEYGIHACTRDQLIRWLSDELYVLEPAEGTDRLDGDKTVVRRARLTRRIETWNETTARLFAADCAESVLYLYEREYPDDDRPRRAVESSPAYARGELDDDARAAAWDAAWAAARAAPWAAAWAAARAAVWAAAWAAPWDAAWAAAWAAARDAAEAAAGDAAEAAAKDAFTDRLFRYLEHGADAADEPLPDMSAIIESAARPEGGEGE